MEKVQIRITGIQQDEQGQPCVVEQFLEGQYGQRGESRYLFYEEADADTPVPIRCRLKYIPHRVELSKQGVVRTEMIFAQQENHPLCYETPYGQLSMTIATQSVEWQEEENRKCLQIKYRLIAADEPIAVCDLKIEINVTV